MSKHIRTTQEEGFQLLISGKNVFLGGRAGTGKSYLIRKFVEWCQEQKKYVSVTASTGIAATHVNGTTLHSFCGIGLGPYPNETIDDFIGRVASNKFFLEEIEPEILRTNVLIIDEISMLDGRTFVYIDALFREIFQKDVSFGGIQIVVVGDFFQLAPVTKFGQRTNWIFNSQSWKELDFELIHLTKSYRQDDESFVNLLNEIRLGLPSAASEIVLNSRVTNIIPEDAVILMTHNKDVEQYNTNKLVENPNELKTFDAFAFGSLEDLKTLQSQILAPQTLNLKIDAKVISVVNNHKLGYYNGSIGFVKGFDEGKIQVKFKNNVEASIERFKWDNTHYQKNKKRSASFTQYPLRLAYSLSIHKAQGLTLDSLYVDLSKVFAEGQCYVALSRAKTLDGIHLKSWNKYKNIVSKEVKAFYHSIGIYQP